MKIQANGLSWNIEPGAIPVIAADLELTRVKFVAGCERCKSICSLVASCACCEKFQKPSPGSPKSYPSDGKHHVIAMSAEEFVRRAKARAA